MTPSPHTKEKDTEAPSNDLAAGVTNCAPASSLANKAAPNPSLVTLLFAHHLQQQQQHQNAMLVSQLAASLSPGLLTQLCLVKQSFSQLQNGGFAATARPGEGLLSSGGGGTGFRMLNFPQFPIAGGGQRPQLSNMAALLKNTQQISQDDSRALEREPLRVRCGSFPERLHQMLLDLEAEEGGQGIASFLENGKAFSIRKQKAFAEQIMPKYFRMNKYSSFQRQLNLYEFTRITEGPHKGAYYHKLFLKGEPVLCTKMKRNKIKHSASSQKNKNNAPLTKHISES